MHGWDLESNELLVQELESDVAKNAIWVLGGITFSALMGALIDDKGAAWIPGSVYIQEIGADQQSRNRPSNEGEIEHSSYVEGSNESLWQGSQICKEQNVSQKVGMCRYSTFLARICLID